MLIKSKIKKSVKENHQLKELYSALFAPARCPTGVLQNAAIFSAGSASSKPSKTKKNAPFAGHDATPAKWSSSKTTDND